MHQIEIYKRCPICNNELYQNPSFYMWKELICKTDLDPYWEYMPEAVYSPHFSCGKYNADQFMDRMTILINNDIKTTIWFANEETHIISRRNNSLLLKISRIIMPDFPHMEDFKKKITTLVTFL